jgi:hypothetical protein
MSKKYHRGCDCFFLEEIAKLHEANGAFLKKGESG